MANILLVEDDPAVLMTLSFILETEGHVVRAAANGFEGLRCMKECTPELTVSDIEMPVLDGPSMALEIFYEDHGLEKVPLIILSGFPDISLIARQVGTPYFLSKPFEIDALSRLVEQALRERIPPIPMSEGRPRRTM
jgi:CheY-like chemotaxis protein